MSHHFWSIIRLSLVPMIHLHALNRVWGLGSFRTSKGQRGKEQGYQTRFATGVALPFATGGEFELVLPVVVVVVAAVVVVVVHLFL